MTRLLLDHGSGGLASHRLIKEIFLRQLGNEVLNRLDDAALLNISGKVAMSTDTFTIDPIFFPGGDIGSLAVHGTVNDVAMLGAVPRYLSCAFILEEGMQVDELEKVVSSMARAASEAEVVLATGDTKVVPKGAVDKIFINTTGIGELIVEDPPQGHKAKAGDAVIVSGNIGDHGLAVLSCREGLSFQTAVKSDSASLNHIIKDLLSNIPEVHVLRDPTRGGLATTLNEIAQQSSVQICLQQANVPIDPAVEEGCSFLGLDPLYLANEGKFICILPAGKANQALEIIKAREEGQNASIIGEVSTEQPGKVILGTEIGGKRLLNMLEGEQLPRIC